MIKLRNIIRFEPNSIRVLDKKDINEIRVTNIYGFFPKDRPWKIIVNNQDEWNNLVDILNKLNYTWSSKEKIIYSDNNKNKFNFPVTIGFNPLEPYNDIGILYNYNYIDDKYLIKYNILKEIKVLGKVTPEMVDKLWEKIFVYSGQGPIFFKRQEKADKELMKDFHQQGEDDWDIWITKQSQNRLKELYIKFQNILNDKT